MRKNTFGTVAKFLWRLAKSVLFGPLFHDARDRDIGLKTSPDKEPHLPEDCPMCGYNLTGNISGRCPECGAPIDPAIMR